MPIHVDEIYLGRSGTESGEEAERLLRREVAYIVRNAANEEAAIQAVRAITLSEDGGLLRGPISAEETSGDVWQVRVPWEAAPDSDAGSWSFETAGGTEHITHSRATTGYAPEGEQAPDPQGAIGATADSVAGCDITTPVYRFSETYLFDAAQVTNEYKGKLFRLTGKTNDAPFKGLGIGEGLFLGASGSKRGEDKWEISFSFAASENSEDIRTPQLIALNFPVIPKKGWEYVWFRYERRKDGVFLVMQPVGIYVAQVYQEGDFGQLGIGV